VKKIKSVFLDDMI